jgi:uncharacterized protein (TIGR02118 family)
MEHVIVALWRAPSADVDGALAAWSQLARADANVHMCTVSRAVDDQGRFAAGTPVDVLVSLGLDRAHDLDDIPERDLLYAIAREVNVWRVDPHRVIVATEPSDITMVSFVARAEGLTHEQFVQHWTEQHAALARKHHIGLAGYTQNVVRRAYTPGGANVDGIAELQFRTREDFEERFYDSDEGRDAIREDVRRFIARPSGQAALMREVPELRLLR